MQFRKFILTSLFFCLCHVFCLCHAVFGQPTADRNPGIQIITSGGRLSEELFVKLIGDPNAKVVFIPTAASSLRSDENKIIWNPDKQENKNEFRDEMIRQFKLYQITMLHTRDRKVADSEEFIKPLREAKAVWISGGNPGRFTSVYVGTKVEKELKALLKRGGIIAGASAGAIVQGSYTIRGNPDKPVLMVKGSEKGLGILKDVAINPHLTGQKRENELVTIIDRYPKLLGIGIDDDTGLIVKDGIGEVFGIGRVAIYDNRKHKAGWYYWLKAGDKFDFNKRAPVNGNSHDLI